MVPANPSPFLLMRTGLVASILWLAIAGDAIAQSQCATTLDREPTAITRLTRPDYSAYLNTNVPAQQRFELHLIGSYDGSGRIVVAPSDKPIVLVVGSYSPSLWRIEPQPGARIARIITLGRGAQRLTGVPPEVEVVRSECRESAYSWEGQNRNVRYMTDAYRRFLAT